MSKRFRVYKNDTIKATLCTNGKLVSSLYDGGFSTIKEIENVLLRRGNYYGVIKTLDFSITNLDKETCKVYSK